MCFWVLTRAVCWSTTVIIKTQAVETKEASDASKRSAQAAEESARIAAEALEISQRAWITVERTDVKHTDGETGLPLWVEPRLHNGGDTPATETRAGAWLECLGGLPARLNFDRPNVKGFGSLRPGNSLSVTAVLDAGDRESFREVKVGRKFLCLNGIVKYRDVFGQEHATVWTYIYDIEHQRFYAWGGDKYNYSN